MSYIPSAVNFSQQSFTDHLSYHASLVPIIKGKNPEKEFPHRRGEKIVEYGSGQPYRPVQIDH
jgi:hypothetical protein